MISLENSAETWDAIKEKRNFLKKRYASQNGSYNKTSNDNANIDDVETGKFQLLNLPQIILKAPPIFCSRRQLKILPLFQK